MTNDPTVRELAEALVGPMDLDDKIRITILVNGIELTSFYARSLKTNSRRNPGMERYSVQRTFMNGRPSVQLYSGSGTDTTMPLRSAINRIDRTNQEELIKLLSRLGVGEVATYHIRNNHYEIKREV